MEKVWKIGVIDFGGQYAHLIASRVRRLGTYTEILSNEESLNKYKEYSGLILSGGPSSVYEENSPKLDKEIFELGIPILGICYGEQLLVHLLGGVVKQSASKEYGKAFLDKKSDSLLLEKFQKSEQVWMSHGDEVSSIPEGFEIIASTRNCKFAAIQNLEKKIYGIQFHPEVTHTEKGSELLKNFISICGTEKTWSLDEYLKRKYSEIKSEVGNKKVFMLISGGVDSTVSYVLLAKSLGKENVKGLLVDTGFMRKNEVLDLKLKLIQMKIDLNIEDASLKFYEALKGKTEPEEKRKIIGDLFLEIQSETSKKFNLNEEEYILGQGTIYPDTIESGSTKHSEKIKTHHNRVDKILEMLKEGKIIEPIKDLYKDEVRELGTMLGLDKSMVKRHPFPGPGLAVRMLSSNPQTGFKMFQELNQILSDFSNIEYKILPIKSVGVQGDKRTYSFSAVINDTIRSYDELEKISTQVTNFIPEINRVLILPFEEKISHLNFNYSRIELNKKNSDILREADAIITKFLVYRELLEKIWQFPVVLIPVGEKDKFSIVLRPVESLEAMTANFYPLDPDILKEMIIEIKKIPEIQYVFFDLTNKPPGTIEWE